MPDPRKRRGRRYLLVFACALSGARNFREAGDHAVDLPQEVFAAWAGVRTLIQAIGADFLDGLVGGWLWGRADAAGRTGPVLTLFDAAAWTQSGRVLGRRRIRVTA